ncbi:hypothetical protein [phage csAssE-Sib]|nr:hypothetical protein [phage csAssE-Sib]
MSFFRPENSKIPLQIRINPSRKTTRHLIFYILIVLFEFISYLQRATNVETKFKNQTTRTYFFNATVQISG